MRTWSLTRSGFRAFAARENPMAADRRGLSPAITIRRTQLPRSSGWAETKPGNDGKQERTFAGDRFF